MERVAFEGGVGVRVNLHRQPRHGATRKKASSSLNGILVDCTTFFVFWYGFCNRSVVNPQPGQFVSEDLFLFLKPFARNSASTVAAVLDQTSAHVFMGSLETAVNKVKG